jgi:hypothetical protein
VPCFRRHDALENAPQHIRRNRTSILFIDGKVEALEQTIERLTPDLIGNVRPMPPLQTVRLEKPTIQERDISKPTGSAAPQLGGLIQRSEEQRAQEVTMDLPPTREAAVDFLGQESFTSREPTLGLNEVQKEHPGQLKKS